MKAHFLFFSFTLLATVNLIGQQPANLCGADCDPEVGYCYDYNSDYGGSSSITLNNDDWHSSGDHRASWNIDQGCQYTQSGAQPPSGKWPCITNSTTIITLVGEGDSGSYLLQDQGYKHLVNSSFATNPSGWGAQSDSKGAVAIAVNGCYSDDPECGLIPITWNGLSPDYGLNEGQDGLVIYENNALTAPLHCPYLTADYYSPIVLDLEGKNFEGAFTTVEHGVVWDFAGRGNLQRLAWTNPDRKIGFLVLDRNHNGRIDNAREMFGNLTHQPMSKEEVQLSKQMAAAHQPWQPNGFLALGFFDRKENGGNENGKIDAGDAVFSELRVWVDTAHDADSRHGELYSLPELGIKAISLAYSESTRTDQYGNKLRFQGTIEMEKVGAAIPNIYDVFFRSASQ